MSRRFGCTIMLIDLLLTLGFGVALILGLNPPAWGLLALMALDIVTFFGINVTQRRS